MFLRMGLKKKFQKTNESRCKDKDAQHIGQIYIKKNPICDSKSDFKYRMVYRFYHKLNFSFINDELITPEKYKDMMKKWEK